jgi:hypothetical protein
MLYIRILALLLFYNAVKAQQYLSNEWYIEFGKQKLRFTKDTAQGHNFFDSDTQIYRCIHGNSNICDSSGKLILAVSPFKAMNGSTNGFIEGGEKMNEDTFTNFLNGTSPLSNTSIILPKGNNQYYVFTTTTSDSFMSAYINIGQWGVFSYQTDEIVYSIVDMNANNGQGKVILNKKLLLRANQYPYLNITCFTATRHANGKDWWLIKPGGEDRQVRYKFLVTPDSIYSFKEEGLPWLTNNFVYHSVGQSCFSKDGTLYAESNSNCPTTIWNFDRCSGQFTLKRIIDIQAHNKDTTTPFPEATGVCFSADNKYLYQGEFYTIYQIDLAEPNDDSALHCLCAPDTSHNFMLNNSLQMTPSGQIYIGHWGGLSRDVNAIMHPNNLGEACEFKYDYTVTNKYLNFHYSGTNDPPNIINYALGALKGSPCDTLNKPQPTDSTNKNTSWQVGPNPATANLYIQVPGADAKVLAVQVYNVLGQRVQSVQYNLNSVYTVQHNIAALASGLYVIQMQVNGTNFYTTKITVR